MHKTADKTKERKHQSIADNSTQRKSRGLAIGHVEENQTKSTEPSQAKTLKFEDNRPEAVAQTKLLDTISNSPRNQQVILLQKKTSDLQGQKELPVQKKSSSSLVSNNGLPDQLKSGIESLSGYAMDDVKVHYNSKKPAQLNAHAYAQGTDIHLASGQEKHLPHEAWHVVQQKQGRVKPTMQLQGQVNVNDDAGLEKEADAMGAKAVQMKPNDSATLKRGAATNIAQRNEAEEITDARVNDLVKRTLDILKQLLVQGADWADLYSKKGNELGKQGFDKVKSKLIGDKSSQGDSLKEKLIKQALKRWWKELTIEEKAEVVSETSKESFNLLKSLGSLVPFGSDKKEKKKEIPEEKKKENESLFMSIVENISTKDIEEGYTALKKYKEIHAKIEEYEKKTSDLVGEVGGSLGEKIGKIRNKKDFEKQFKKQQMPFKVAQQEYKLLEETIKGDKRYDEERDQLKNILEGQLTGPKDLINNPGMFSDEKLMGDAYETCNDAYDSLRIANILRNTSAKSLFARFTRGVSDFFSKNIYQGEEEKAQIASEQKKLVTLIKNVTDKSWKSYTKGWFKTHPSGVEAINKLVKGDQYITILGNIKDHLIKPQKELQKVENELSTVDKDIPKETKKLQSKLQLGNIVEETGSEKGTENLVNDVEQTGKKLLDKGSLEKRKKELSKQVNNENRHPLTQLFYDALRSMEINNLLSLRKTHKVIDTIGKQLKD